MELKTNEINTTSVQEEKLGDAKAINEGDGIHPLERKYPPNHVLEHEGTKYIADTDGSLHKFRMFKKVKVKQKPQWKDISSEQVEYEGGRYEVSVVTDENGVYPDPRVVIRDIRTTTKTDKETGEKTTKNYVRKAMGFTTNKEILAKIAEKLVSILEVVTP